MKLDASFELNTKAVSLTVSDFTLGIVTECETVFGSEVADA